MSRVFLIFLIFSLIVIHGEVNHAMFGGNTTTIQSATDLHSDLHNTIIDDQSSKRVECCKDKETNKPVKVSYCQLDHGLGLLAIEYCFPSFKQPSLPGHGKVLNSKEPVFPLRPPIA